MYVDNWIVPETCRQDAMIGPRKELSEVGRGRHQQGGVSIVKVRAASAAVGCRIHPPTTCKLLGSLASNHPPSPTTSPTKLTLGPHHIVAKKSTNPDGWETRGVVGRGRQAPDKSLSSHHCDLKNTCRFENKVPMVSE